MGSPPPASTSPTCLQPPPPCSTSSPIEGRHSAASSRKSGHSLKLQGITVEETSTDLSIDLARDLVSDEEVEEEDEEPIVPIMKAEPPRKEKRSEEEEKKGTPFLTPQDRQHQRRGEEK